MTAAPLRALLRTLLPCFLVQAAAVAQFPPLSTEISAVRPLFIFQDLEQRDAGPEAYAAHVAAAWASLPEDLKPFSALQVELLDPGMRPNLTALLEPLKAQNVPVVVRIANDDPYWRFPLADLEALLNAHTHVRGVEVTGLQFNEYYPAAQEDYGTPADVRWLAAVIEAAARYGRFVHAPLGEMQWARIMANASAGPLYTTLMRCRDYVIPGNLHRGPQTIPRQSALMGLWLEGAAGHWSVAADSRWYTGNDLAGVNTFGAVADPASGGEAAAPLYRAMVLNGAMGGATVYAFAPGADLWFSNASAWNNAIAPVLREILAYEVIAPKEQVQKEAHVAYQMTMSTTPEAFHLNLRDIDPTFDLGLLVHAAYGVAIPGQMPELILNRGQHYWIPVLSPRAAPEILGAFPKTITPGSLASVQAWAEAIAPYAESDGEGSACIVRVGRGLFIMNTQENLTEQQLYRIPAAPAPVRGVQARREGGGIIVSWPTRPNDLVYTVYRRVHPTGAFQQAAQQDATQPPQFTDAEPGAETTVAYAVTAKTNEVEPLEGSVGYGEFLVYSTVESRIVEEAVLTPVLTNVQARPLATPVINPRAAAYAGIPPVTTSGPSATPNPSAELLEPAPPPVEPLITAASVPVPVPVPLGPVSTWWPSFEGVPDGQRATAEAIVARIEAWDTSFESESFFDLLDVYSITAYEDAQGWGFQYVRRAYQWFFERYANLRMQRQIRRWDFATSEGGGPVDIILYLRLSGIAVSDATGRTADIPVVIPREAPAEVRVSWIKEDDGQWRILRTDPALPNFRELLSYSAGPYDNFPTGPDEFTE